MRTTRQHLEDRERLTLAPYAVHSGDTRGRHHPEDETAYRTVFQRDRDRVLHTTAFRRLEYKTQVFLNSVGDYYRTRLTHTLEVAQIGRTIARALAANEDLVEVICLAHDLGHPPFGHSGEHALNALMEHHNGFDHNKQTYRIVTELERRYPDFNGLNLTWETLEGIVKHETEYDIADANLYDPDLRGSLEAQIANIADELAYTAHDLDDGLRSGMINPFQLTGKIALWDRVCASIGWDGIELGEMTRQRLIRRLIGIEVDAMIAATDARLTAANPQSARELQQLDHNVVGWNSEFAALNREMKRFLYENLYRHYRVMRMAEKAERVLSDLFHAYVRQPQQLPPTAYKRIENVGLPRAVCDYLAGMTDRYALEEHAKLFDPNTRP